MAVAQPPSQSPQATQSSPADSAAGRLWSMIDQRIMALVNAHGRQLGVPRPRMLTMVFPLADSGGVLPTDSNNLWLSSVPVFTHCMVTAWSISALGPGSIQLDVWTSQIQVDTNSGQPDPSVSPTLQSLVTGASVVLPPVVPTTTGTPAPPPTGTLQLTLTGTGVGPFGTQVDPNVAWPYPALSNGYTTGLNSISLNSQDPAGGSVNGWFANEINAGDIVHLFVLSSSSLTDAVFGLQLQDLHGRMLQLGTH